jgi:hypothetical protein
MKKLNDKQKKFLLKVQDIQLLELMPTPLVDFTEGDDEGELLADGNYWVGKDYPIRIIKTALETDTYDTVDAAVLNSVCEYYKRHYYNKL